MRKLTRQFCFCSILAMTLSLPPAVMAGNAGTTAGQAGAGLCSAGIMGFMAAIVGLNLPSVLTWTSPMQC